MTATYLPIRSRLGPYEILNLLGAGGMGEVYRARDTRLRRDVAIKVLPPAYAGDPDLLKRLEREARAVSQLNHPNIVAVYDLGSDEGFEYVVMELLEGETLGNKLRSGALSPRKTLEYAVQIARGLAAAHEKNIVHRDLKPENIFLTRNGQVKILDFGLARQLPASDSAQISSRLTTPGMVMGTAAYMSPEQARGAATDHRSDLFSFGVVLYEMLSGTHPFEADTPFETMVAILNREPVDLAAIVPNLPPILHRVVTHCLEKAPEARFQSAHDLIFDLENCSEIATGSLITGAAPRAPMPKPRAWAMTIGAIVAIAAIVGATLAFERLRAKPDAGPAFRRMTFGRGIVQSARFTGDGDSIVYAASWDGQPLRLFLLRTERPESQTLALPNASLLAISRMGEMAIMPNGRLFDWVNGGTLAQVPVLGGTPREVLEGVIHADWSPDGRLGVWRRTDTGSQLEFPIGRVLFTTPDQVAMALRISPKGDQIALHLAGDRLTGEVSVVGVDGKKRTLAPNVVSAPGLAWTPDGAEVWFAATPAGDKSATPAIFAVNMAGEQRLVARMPGWLWLHDISREGMTLLTYNSSQSGIILPATATQKERDLSWLDWSVLADISSDGRSVLFTEAREGVANTATVYLRGTDGSPAVRLGEGVALAYSPRNDWVLALSSGSARREVVVLPTRAGKIETVRNNLDCLWAGWLPDGRILITARTPQGPRMFVQPRDGATPQPVTPPGISIGFVTPEGGNGGVRPVSPDGRWMLVFDRERRAWLYPTSPAPNGDQPRRLNGVLPGDRPAGWSRDGQRLYVYQAQQVPLKVHEIHLLTGERKLHREITLSDIAGVYGIGPVLLTPDGESFAYGYVRTMSTLYTAENLK